MSVLQFPNVKPQFLRTIQTPDYTLATIQAKSGYENTIRKSFTGYSATLSIEYQHISEAEAVEIIEFYNEVQGTAIAFSLPENFFNVQDIVIDSIADLGSTTRWKFANEPTLTLLVATPSRGRYNWQIQLKAVYPGSTGFDGEIIPTDEDPIDVTDAPVVDPVIETETDEDVVIVTPVDNVDNPVETPDETNVITRLVRTKITLNISETITASSSLSKLLDFCKSFMLYRVDCNQKIRLRLYLNEVYKDADVFRDITVRPSTNSGLIYEAIYTSSIDSIFLEPVANAYNVDDTNQPYAIHITNLDVSSISNFDIDFYIIPLEV